MTPADEHRLQAVFRREHRSLLQYVRESSPYVSSLDRKLLDSVSRVMTEETAALQELGDFLESKRVALPYLGSFPIAYTDLNFVAIRYLLPKLITEQKHDLAVLEADTNAIADPSVRSTLATLTDLHRRHLAELEQLIPA